MWCLPFFANFGEVTIPDNIIGIPALPITSVLVGSFVTRSHEVAGKMHALNTRQIELRNFFFDGRGRGKSMRGRWRGRERRRREGEMEKWG